MANKRASTTFITPDYTIVFPSLVEARQRKDPATGRPYVGSTPKFEQTMAFTFRDYKDYVEPQFEQVLKKDFHEDDVEAALAAVFSSRKAALRLPVQTGESFNARRVKQGKEAFADLEDCVLVASTSNTKPGAVDAAGKEIDNSAITGGSTCCAEIVIRTMDGALYTGAVCYVNNVQLIKQAGRRPATEVFKPRSGGSSVVNPFKKHTPIPAAEDDEIPF